MGRDDPFMVRDTTLDPRVSGTRGEAVVNRLGFQTQVDFLTQMVLSGFGFHIQAGTEDAGVAATAAIDDELAFILADNRAGNVMIPLLYEVTPGSVADTFVLLMAMLEADKEKARYASGGTVFVPENMNGSDQNTFSGVAYAGGDVIPAAKSAVPDSVELARRFFYEDTLAAKIGYAGWHKSEVYTARKRPLCVLHDASSIVGHLGSTTALATGYGVLQLLQFPKGYIV
jgi:hypothetical protein